MRHRSATRVWLRCTQVFLLSNFKGFNRYGHLLVASGNDLMVMSRNDEYWINMKKDIQTTEPNRKSQRWSQRWTAT